jgi:hypothetical protein
MEAALLERETLSGTQKSALLRHKALFCPRKRHCSSTKRFPVPEFRLVGQQSIFLTQKSALLHHNALSCPNFSFIRCQSTLNPFAKGCFSFQRSVPSAPQ